MLCSNRFSSTLKSTRLRKKFLIHFHCREKVLRQENSGLKSKKKKPPHSLRLSSSKTDLFSLHTVPTWYVSIASATQTNVSAWFCIFQHIWSYLKDLRSALLPGFPSYKWISEAGWQNNSCAGKIRSDWVKNSDICLSHGVSGMLAHVPMSPDVGAVGGSLYF